MDEFIKLLKRKYRYFRERIFEKRLCAKEYRAGARKTHADREASFKSQMLIQAHRVEKGLGLENCEPGHSSDVALDLVYRLNEYIRLGYDASDFAFRETFAILNAYYAYQKDYGSPDWAPLKKLESGIKGIAGKIGSENAKHILSETAAGVAILTKEEIETAKSIDFDALASTRHSMRMYMDKPVSSADIKAAVETANKAPSACNRQPARVYFAKSPASVDAVNRLITGNHGFEGKTPNYIILTEDRACFSREEEFQWYINGGIYASFLVMALHSRGIGSCIMQWKAFHKTEPELKKLFKIRKTEAIAAIIGCGYYRENTKVIRAQRKSAEETLETL